MPVQDRTFDKIGAFGTLVSLADLFSNLSRRSGGGGGGGTNATGGPATKTALASAIEFGIEMWKNHGGSKEDEAAILKAFYSDIAAKHTELTPLEGRKVAAVMAKMEQHERLVFRIALSLMKPETVPIKVKAKVDKDGKVTEPASERHEKTGVDHQINTLKGIAKRVKSDLSNAQEVMQEMRNIGGLGGDNKSLEYFRKMQTHVAALLCAICGVKELKEVDGDYLKAKLYRINELWDEVMAKLPDPNAPLPPAGWFVRLLTPITPGAPKVEKPKAAPRAVAGRQAPKRRSNATHTVKVVVWTTILVCLGVSGFLYYDNFTGNGATRRENDAVFRTYQPATLSADMPKKKPLQQKE